MRSIFISLVIFSSYLFSETINGYQLPPEPDPKINNSTFLGIDSNSNGVRDDVERKIVITFKEPIKIELMFQDARIQQKILEESIDKALELEKLDSKVGDCAMYLKKQKVLSSKDIESRVEFIENNTYNTRKRVRKYLDYNQALSGGVYGSSPADWNSQACDFDVETMLKKRNNE